MADFAKIFDKQRLTPGQLRAVAERRYNDARCLHESGSNQRANGAIYMGGFVIECLFKALLLERYPNLQRKLDPASLSSADKDVFGLLYSHDLGAMMGYFPEVDRKLNARVDGSGRRLLPRFKAVCAEWTIYARYSPRSATIAEAGRFLETIAEVKTWLREL